MAICNKKRIPAHGKAACPGSYLPLASIAHYLAGFIAIFPSSVGGLPNTLTAFNTVYIPLTDALGIPRNDSKDAAGTLVSVLRVEIDTTLLQAHRVAHKALQRVVGFLQHCSMVIRLGRARLQSLYSDLASFPPHQRSVRHLSHNSREDLAWWRDTLPLFNGIHFFEKSRPLVALYTDACDSGLGLFFFYASLWDSAGDWMMALAGCNRPAESGFAT
ncbi:hypothetical protein N7486_004761 [Penicillium sp. IBT 16267x]|nr:hypothetical protein N7486_004761 [Penicillium sp. IBT 16267x]